MSLIPQNLQTQSGRGFAPVGLDAPVPPIARTAEGSIDYNQYLVKSRALRADAYGTALRGLGRFIGKALSKVAAGYRNWQAHRRAVAELNGLDDRSLRDLGVNRAGLDYVVDHGREDVPAAANSNVRKAA